jgi:hypothetical protein
MNKESRGLTRQQLYESVWTQPIYRLAPLCGVTDVGMAKLCRRYRIPVPGRGYWRKLETGGTVPKRPPLPRFPDFEADAIIARLRDQEAPVEPSKPFVAPAFDAAVLHPVAASAWERLKDIRANREDVLDAGYLGLKVMPDRSHELSSSSMLWRRSFARGVAR